MRRIPNVTVTVSEGYSEHVLDQLINSQVDVAVASPAASWLGHEDLIAEPIFSVRECAIARAGHPLAQKSAVSLKDLSEAMWIQGRFLTESYEALCQCFVTAGLTPPKRLLWSDAFASGLALILRNDLVTFASPGLFESEIERGTLVELRAERPRRERVAYMFRRRRGVQSPATESMLDEMRGLAQDTLGARSKWLTPTYAAR
jgi:LysR family transcriptional regulator of gallate degradation